MNVQEWGRNVFQIDDVTRTMSKGGGGAPGVPPIQVQTPPPTWLAGYGPAYELHATSRSIGLLVQSMAICHSMQARSHGGGARGGGLSPPWKNLSPPPLGCPP